MDQESAFKAGFLFIPPQNFLRKTWLKRYCVLYSASNQGIQRIELFESEDAYIKQMTSKIVPLTDCVKVTPFPQKIQHNVFEVRTQNNSYQFSTDTFQEMSEWLVALQTVAFSKSQYKSASSVGHVIDEKQEENQLYSSMDEPEVYTVKAVSTEATLRNNLKGSYILIITSVNISTAEICPQGKLGRVLLTWPYRHIRRYGCSADNFSFEAGRKCPSGEGLFSFATSDGKQIFQSVDSYVSALKTGQFDVLNSPSIKDESSFMFPANNYEALSFNISNKPDLVGVFPLDSEATFDERKHHNLKAVPPFGKPPRKSKTTAFDSSSDSSFTSNQSVQSSSASHSNQYDEIFSENLVEKAKTVLNNSVSEPNVLEQESFKPEDLQQPKSYNIEPASTNPDNLIIDIKNFKFDSSNKNTSSLKKLTHLDYENYETSPINGPSRIVDPDDHTYGKIFSIKNSLASSIKPSSFSHQSFSPHHHKNTVPLYSNIPMSNEVIQYENNPEHFYKNDSEYAKVLKKK